MKPTIILTALLMFWFTTSFSQQIEMADGLRSEGKIYVVVLVVAIITAGLFGYLFYLDKKISKQEKSKSE